MKNPNVAVDTPKHENIKGVIVIEGHIQGLANTRLLGKAGIPVIVIDKSNCVARYSKYCKKYYKCPDYNSDEFIDFLRHLQANNDTHGWLLLPSNDHAVHNIARHKQVLSEHYSIITENLETINQIYRKRDLLKIAEKVYLPIPETFFPEKVNPSSVNLRYPIIIKGNEGLSFYKKYNRKAILINNEMEFRDLMQNQLRGIKPEEYFIQEVIPNNHKTVSVTVFSIMGAVHTYWMGIKLREHPIRFGTATCCKSMIDEVAIQQSIELIKEINYTGICEIEWLKDSRDDKYKLIEINARTWLWVGLAEKCGINYPLIMYNYIFHGIIPSHIAYKENVTWINIYTDIIYSLIGIIRKCTNIKSVIHSYSKFYEASWDLKDPLPFFMYGMLSFDFLKRR
jgi:predicted ATP-grasp superfamily ATP-dependent carboligase